MKKVALVHTVPSVYATFPGMLRAALGEVKITNTVDEFLSSDAVEKGMFTVVNRTRLHNVLKNAEMAEADVIGVTCSTLSPWVELLRPFIAVPMVTIDGAMFHRAADLGTRMTVFATASSAVEPTKEALQKEAAKSGKTIEFDSVASPEAFVAIKALDWEKHDNLLREAAKRIKKTTQVVVLAQASMAHMEKEIRDITGVETISGPKYCIEEIREILARGGKS